MEILIRHAEPEDYAALQGIMAQPGTYSGTLQMPYPTAERWRKRLESTPESTYSLVACVEEQVVGQIALHVEQRPRRNHAAGIGMAVHEQWQGKGVGTALMEAVLDLADNWLNLMRLELTVYIDNQAAIHLYRKFGFAVEGTLRGYAFRNGAYVDAYSMARLRLPEHVRTQSGQEFQK